MYDLTETPELLEAKAAAAFIANDKAANIAGFVLITITPDSEMHTAANVCCEYHLTALLVKYVSEQLNGCLKPCCGGDDACG